MIELCGKLYGDFYWNNEYTGIQIAFEFLVAVSLLLKFEFLMQIVLLILSKFDKMTHSLSVIFIP